MSYNIPPNKDNNTDAQCPGGTSVNCGAPSTIDNINLTRAEGGTPGFITITRHMCVGDSIESGPEFTKPSYGSVLGKTVIRDASPSTPRSQYPYACGYFDYARNVVGDSTYGNPYSSQQPTPLWNCSSGACSQWFDFFCHIFFGCFKDNDPTNAGSRSDMGMTTEVSYLTNPDQPKRKTLLDVNTALSSNRYTVKFQNITPIIKGAGRTYRYETTPTGAFTGDVKIHSIIRHPKMNREELRFFGVKEEDFDKVMVAASGTDVKINYSCLHSEANSVSIAFFKWDLSTIVNHDGRVTVKGEDRDLYKIISQKINNGEMHSTDKVMEYVLLSSWFRNGANRGNTGASVNATVTIPLEPFWDDNTIMVVFIGNRVAGRGKYSDSRLSLTKNIVDGNWSGAVKADGSLGTRGTPFTTTGLPWSNSGGGDGKHCGCKLQITVPEYEEVGVGCSQTRNIDWLLYSDTTQLRKVKPLSDGKIDQMWNSPSQGSHIMKIVPNNYYENECTWRVSKAIRDISQNSVVYAANCLTSVGDPYINEHGFLSKESPIGIHYLEKCNSYSMNISPNAEISNQSRCCSPKISGPFLLDKLPYGEDELIKKNDSLHDSPDLSSNYRPNLNYFNKNFAYHLENRMDCECSGSDCAKAKCYECPSFTKTEYEACKIADECKDKQDCCKDPCSSCPNTYGLCIATGECEQRGCCSLCEDCVSDTIAEYNDCLANTGTWATRGCKSRNCCSIQCDGCPQNIIDCIAVDICKNSDCCRFLCDVECDIVNRGTIEEPIFENKTLSDYWNCIQNKGKYSTYPKSECSNGCCCQNPCDKYRSGVKTVIRSDAGVSYESPYLRADCENDPRCVEEECVGYLPEIQG